MLTIRLSRVGKKNKPMYRLVISEKARDPYGRALEILGSYNPHTKELQAKGERIKYWISKGSQMSPTVNNLLIEKSIIEGEKIKASRTRKKKKGGEEEKSEKKPTEGAEKKDPSASLGQAEQTTEDNKAEDKKDDAAQPAEKKEEAPKTEDNPAEEPKKEAENKKEE